MKSNFSIESIDQILKVNFFSECGNLSFCKDNNAYQCVNKDVAEKLAISEQWEYYTQEQAGNLTANLYKKNADELSVTWNMYIKQFNELWDNKIHNKVLLDIQAHKFTNELIHVVKWDLLHFTMRQCFLSYNPPRFYNDIFLVYESGHYPCGVNDFTNFESPKILIY